MANQSNQKLKILRLMEIFYKYTDEEHAVKLPEIIERLNEYDIHAERKSLYNDIEILRDFGMDIVYDGETKGYFLASREFETAELKMLSDAVSASKFITEKKSDRLMKKLSSLSSIYEENHLRRQVVVSDRIKSENESVYYTVDTIYNCIDGNRQMEFCYASWTPEKKYELRRDGEVYRVSPIFLLWDNENYYLVAYDEGREEIRHYRVDKIVKARISEEKRNPSVWKGKVDPKKYQKKTFGMFKGEEAAVTLECDASLAGVIIDRFGVDIPMHRKPEDKERLIAHVGVEVSPQFFGWITGLSGKVRIVSPGEVVSEYKKYLSDIAALYADDLPG